MDHESDVQSGESIDTRYLDMSRQAIADRLLSSWHADFSQEYSEDEFNRVVKLGSEIYRVFDFLDTDERVDVNSVEGQQSLLARLAENPDLQASAYVAVRLANLHSVLLDKVAVQESLEAGSVSVDEAIERVLDAKTAEIEMRARVLKTIDELQQ